MHTQVYCVHAQLEDHDMQLLARFDLSVEK